MSDGTPLNVGAGGDTVFDEDVSGDAVGGFSGKVPAFKIYVGGRGSLGAPVDSNHPLPARNDGAVSLLESLLGEARKLNDRLGDLGDVLEVHDGYIVVREGVGIQFGLSGPRIFSQSGVPTRTDLNAGSVCLRSDPGGSSTTVYVYAGGVWTPFT